MRSHFIRRSVALFATAALGSPPAAHADRCHRFGHGRNSWDGIPGTATAHGYGMLKGGGMMLGGDAGPTGSYFGLEVGQTLAERVDFGFSLDWFHRSDRDMAVLFETDHGFQPPLRGEITRFESSSDFVPLGFTLRLRMPLANPAIVPFVSGTLSYEILHLDFFARDFPPGPYDALLGNSQTLMGFGWQVAGGVEIALAPGVGLFGEAGLHHSDPSRQLEFSGSPVDVRASLHGGFMRAGVRVGL
jgi:hypothetical protein